MKTANIFLSNQSLQMDKGGGANVGDDGASVLNNYDNKKIKNFFLEKVSLPGGTNVGKGGASVPPVLVH